MNNQEKLKNIFAEKFGISPEEITPETSISKYAEDSMSRIEFLFELEQLIGKKFPEDSIFDIETFGDIVKIIDKLN
jgi:acyl carrier protein